MKLLLTSAGIKNPTLHQALEGLLGKPIAEANALCIPTASWSAPWTKPTGPWRFITGTSGQPMVDLGWKSVGVLELTALPSIDSDRWQSWVRETEALLVSGGDGLFLAHWMRETGFADLIQTLPNLVYVGFSAGSMALAPRLGEDFVYEWRSPAGDDRAVGLVDFSIFPHVDHPDLPENTMAAAEKWAASLDNPSYAIDDDTAIKIVDGTIEIVTEGHWKAFA